MILMELRFALEDEGIRSVDAFTAEGALARIAQAPPDAAILDVNLGGGETCEPVAQHLRTLGVPFILYTGDLDRQGELVASLQAEVVPKPTPGHLVAQRALGLIGR